MIALLVALCWLDARADRPGIFLVPLVIALCVLATGELLQMFRACGGNPVPWAMYVGTLLPVLVSYLPTFLPDDSFGLLRRFDIGLALGLVLGLAVPLAAEMWRYGRSDNSAGQSTLNLAYACFSILYLGGLMGFLVQLRMLPGIAYVNWGLKPLLSLVFVVKMSDTGQYFVGTLFGKRKLAPILSPGKTWEGTIGGIIVSGIVTASVLSLYLESMAGAAGWSQIFLYCLIISLAGLVGDLAESLLKRDAGVKDSSTWLPGLGGVLDMLDSLLLAAPVAYLCWVCGLVGR